ncbi:MAG: Fe-S cluster assembly protein SufD [Woeseia sp.]|nr:Fe-S cluster assembly protein SufD [Woeseia sp.]
MNKTLLQADLLAKAQTKLPNDALRAVRQALLPDVTRHGFPTTRDEDWRYTNLSHAVELSNTWLSDLLNNTPAVSAELNVELPEVDAHGLVLVDGLVDEVALQRVQSALDGALRIGRLRDNANRVHAEGPLDTLNAAMLQDGLFIEVPTNHRADKPLAIYLHDGAMTASQSRIVIDVGPNATIDLIEYHLRGADTAHFANSVTQINLAEGATVNYVRIQQRDRKHVQTGKLAAKLHRDATLSHAAFDLGGGLTRSDIVADLLEPGAAVHMNGLYLADDEQHIDNHTRVDHRVGPAISREEYRGILNGAARCVFNGKAIVHEGADGTDAQQANHNLLLSNKAEVDTKPELEIYADDVKCAHGATVGELDESAIFYMQSRGLDRDQAAHMLTRAFAAQILSKLPVSGLHAHIEGLVDARLDELLQERAS